MRMSYLIAVTTLTVASGAAGAICPGDLDGSGVVDGADLAAMLAVWGAGPGTPADLNGDGVVDGADLASLLAAWGDCPTFVYATLPGTPEAQQIALETLGPGGALQPDATLIARVTQDLAAIRDAEPSLVGQTHSPAWDPTSMIIQVDLDADMSELECLNEIFSATMQPLFSNWFTVHFPGKLNIPAMVEEYTSGADAVLFAEPNGLIGGQNFWIATPLAGGVWRWDIDDGFLDCFDGCDCHTVWVFEVTARGEVELISTNQFGQPWCNFP